MFVVEVLDQRPEVDLCLLFWGGELESVEERNEDGLVGSQEGLGTEGAEVGNAQCEGGCLGEEG